MSKPIHVCTTVFNRYDLLRRQFASLRDSRVQPQAVYVIDRGDRPTEVIEASLVLGSIRFFYVNDYAPAVKESQCLAQAWNWFCQNVPEERVIVGEDSKFLPDSFERIYANPEAAVLELSDGHSAGFAAFVMRDKGIEQVGLFDELISPQYVYYEDIDWKHRAKLAGVEIGKWTNGVFHSHQHDNVGTLGAKTAQQIADHHRRFSLAQANYERKWGGLPPNERFALPYGARPRG